MPQGGCSVSLKQGTSRTLLVKHSCILSKEKAKHPRAASLSAGFACAGYLKEAGVLQRKNTDCTIKACAHGDKLRIPNKSRKCLAPISFSVSRFLFEGVLLIHKIPWRSMRTLKLHDMLSVVRFILKDFKGTVSNFGPLDNWSKTHRLQTCPVPCWDEQKGCHPHVISVNDFYLHKYLLPILVRRKGAREMC